MMQQIYLEFETDKALFQSYMPFLKNGGLFFRTTEPYELGTEVLLHVSLPDSLESSQIKGAICWITPVGAQNGTPAGVGIAFLEDKDNIRHQIEKSLGRLLHSSDITLTM